MSCNSMVGVLAVSDEEHEQLESLGVTFRDDTHFVMDDGTVEWEVEFPMDVFLFCNKSINKINLQEGIFIHAELEHKLWEDEWYWTLSNSKRIKSRQRGWK